MSHFHTRVKIQLSFLKMNLLSMIDKKIQITVTKKDKETYVPLAGAKFGLYADQNIYAHQVASPRDKDIPLVTKGTLIETRISDENGNVQFKADLPLSQYFVKEIEPPIGYISSDEVLYFNATYQGQDIKTIELQINFKNEITKVEVSKQDITDESEIEGVQLTFFEKDDPGSIFDTWISDQDGKNEDGTIRPHLMKGLEVGQTSSPYGFALSQDIEFTVKDTGEIQNAVMKDVEFNISIHEDMSEVIQSAKTDEKGIASFKDLELGTYYI